MGLAPTLEVTGQGNLQAVHQFAALLLKRSIGTCLVKTRALYAGLFSFHSPLLRESRLISFPGLIDMLKSGPYS